MAKTDRAAELANRWGISVEHALYSQHGTWYHVLQKFPAALFDQSGYILFRTKEEYKSCRQLKIGKEINIRSGIKSIPGYIQVLTDNIDILQKVQNLSLGEEYERKELAKLWGYKDWQSISRGVVTPKGEPVIILFVTKEKQIALPQYMDRFEGDDLYWEGENHHQSDERIIESAHNADHIFLFYREHHRNPSFRFFGEIKLKDAKCLSEKPSEFVFSTNRSEALALSAMRTEDATHGIAESEPGPDTEGLPKLKQHVTYERSAKNRARAIDIHGHVCYVCKFDFNAFYGNEHAANYIEVHHIVSVAKGIRKHDPANDLFPLCANCHKMAHRRRNIITPLEKLQELIAAAKKKAN